MPLLYRFFSCVPAGHKVHTSSFVLALVEHPHSFPCHPPFAPADPALLVVALSGVGRQIFHPLSAEFPNLIKQIPLAFCREAAGRDDWRHFICCWAPVITKQTKCSAWRVGIFLQSDNSWFAGREGEVVILLYTG